MQKKILLTGINGFIGKKLALHFTNIGYSVIGLDINSNSSFSSDYIQCDISIKDEVFNRLSNVKFDTVVHCAAIAHNDTNKFSDEDFNRVNYIGTKNIVDFLSKNGNANFLYFSTIAVYGEYGINTPIKETVKLNPVGNYAVSKFKAEKYIIDNYINNYTILRFSPIYSDLNLKDIQKRVLLKKIGKYTLIANIGNGRQKYSFVNIKNVIEVVDFFVKNKVNSNVYNVCDKSPYSQKELVDYFNNKYKNTVNIYIPKFIFKISFMFLRLFLRSKDEALKSIYWKLTMNNIYSTEKLNTCGIIHFISLLTNKI